MRIHRALAATTVIALLAAGLAGCNGGQPPKAPPASSSATGNGPIPPALRTVESASEDAIDDALAGNRAGAVTKALRLQKAASGPVPTALRKAGVSERRIADFKARADRVAALAPKADLLQVALASNHAFEAVAGFFALYDSRVPAVVTTLDYLDFEAKLRAKAGDLTAVRRVVGRLGHTWTALKPTVISAGGSKAAAAFSAHVEAMHRLVGAGDQKRLVHEAQHGLDLVDEIEEVFA